MVRKITLLIFLLIIFSIILPQTVMAESNDQYHSIIVHCRPDTLYSVIWNDTGYKETSSGNGEFSLVFYNTTDPAVISFQEDDGSWTKLGTVSYNDGNLIFTGSISCSNEEVYLQDGIEHSSPAKHSKAEVSHVQIENPMTGFVKSTLVVLAITLSCIAGLVSKKN